MEGLKLSRGFESLPLRHKFVARRWLLVARKKGLKHAMLGGFEADPNASGGGRMSRANDSEGGRLRRRSGTTGEKESLPLRQESYIVLRMSYIVRKETKRQERGIRSLPSFSNSSFFLNPKPYWLLKRQRSRVFVHSLQSRECLLQRYH